MVYINTSNPDGTNYSIKFLRGNTIVVTKEFLNSINVTEYGSISISLEYYINKSYNLTKEQIYPIMFPEVP